jgi:hypothetical protein
VAAVHRYRAGDKTGAVDIFFRAVFGTGYRAALDHGLPGAFAQALADADAFFTQELPPSTSGRSLKTTPVASSSQRSPSRERPAPAIFAERQKLLLHWLPNAEPLDLPGLTHLLYAQPRRRSRRTHRLLRPPPDTPSTLTGRGPGSVTVSSSLARRPN